LHKSDGICGISKRLFYGMFKKAWDLALTEKNILSAWEKTGISPFNPSKVLDQIQVKEWAGSPDIEVNGKKLEPPTPRNARDFRHFKQEFQRNPFKVMIRKLMKAAETSSAEREIANYRASCFKEALEIEKKKRQRGKKLNLDGTVATGGGQFFSNAEIQVALKYQAGKEAALLKDKEEKEAKKIEAAKAKAVKEALEKKARDDKREQAAADKQILAEQKKEEAARKKHEAAEARAAVKAAKDAEKAAKKAKPSKVVISKLGGSYLKSLGSHEDVEVAQVSVEEEVVEHVTRRGRKIILPQRMR
jgi:hypothetical protein